ncbi:hypothetical protein BDV93DRAFT_584780 [Ceratobasidium sp. AG-I]|nr:hypothetical protein BDV93DRAFT_584780 [Ceratobasidium sp. AG-I]
MVMPKPLRSNFACGYHLVLPISMLHILPSELIELILEQCNFIDIVHISETCKKLLKLVSKSNKLQLHVELVASGFELCESASQSGQGPGELLEKLKSIRDKWLYLDIPRPYNLEIPEPFESMTDYVPRLGYIPPEFEQDDSSSFSTFYGFDLATHKARVLEPGFRFSKSSADVSQDLLVLISYEKYDTDGSSHPLALYSSWAIELPRVAFLREGHIQIEFLDNLLAIGFYAGEGLNEILIWDWRSGVMLNRISIKGTCSFGFLTPDCLSVFNCTNEQGEDHSIGLFVYNIHEPLTGAPVNPTNTCIASDYTALSPSVELCFPSRRVPLMYITQHFTHSRRNPSTSSSSIFRISQAASMLHLTLCFRGSNDTRNPPPKDVYEIFISKSKLLKYTAALAPSTDHLRRIGWVEWMEDCTRWFHSEPLIDSQASRWMMEGTRAIGTNYLKRENDGRGEYDYMTLLDFHPPTVRRLSNSRDSHRSMSLWEGVEVRHVDIDSARMDLDSVFEILEGRDHGSNVFVDVVDKDAPTFTLGFEEGTVVSRLPYRMVTRRMTGENWFRWALDENRILEVPLFTIIVNLVGLLYAAEAPNGQD